MPWVFLSNILVCYMEFEGMVRVTSNRQCLKQVLKQKYIDIYPCFCETQSQLVFEMIKGLTPSYMLRWIFTFNTCNVICFRFHLYVYNWRIKWSERALKQALQYSKVAKLRGTPNNCYYQTLILKGIRCGCSNQTCMVKR